MFVLVVPFSKSFDDFGLTYLVPKELEKYVKAGIVVDISLGNNTISGVVIDILKEIDFDEKKVKSIISIKYEQPLLYDYQIQTLRWISKYYFCKIHSSFNLFFPRILKEKIEKIKLNLETIKDYKYIFNYDKILTKPQQKAFDEIIKSDKEIVFYGVTGSGKTEIYINLVKRYLDLGKQSLVIVPEIILNNQVFDRFKSVFGDDVIMINSSITETNKYKNRIDIYNNKAKIIIGTRSSLFYPYKDLGLLIVDEEHDLSYKSDANPRFDTREVVSFIHNFLDLKIIFASGTPSIKTIYKGLNKTYDLVNLLDEYSF